MKKRALTTFEAAKISDVTHVTIQNWIKKGWLKSYRTAGGHRRIERENLSAFLNSKRMPINSGSKDGFIQVLILEDDKNVSDLIRLHLVSRSKMYDVKVVEDLFSAGLFFSSYKPSLMIIDISFPDIDFIKVYEEIRKNSISENNNIMIINSGRTQKSLSAISNFISLRVYNVPEEISDLMENLSNFTNDFNE